MKKDLVVISVGGSLVVPDDIDTKFLKAFKGVIEKEIKRGKRFIIVCGGGKTARNHQKALKDIGGIKKEDIDWVGIEATFLNAMLIKLIFNEKICSENIVKNPKEKKVFRGKILIAAGWKPGRSTDYNAVVLAENFGAGKILNLTNISFIYDKDPTKFKNARPIKKISWKEFIKLLPKKWSPGLNFPFDPIASRRAKRLGIEVAILDGKKTKQIENYLAGKDFIGTRIR